MRTARSTSAPEPCKLSTPQTNAAGVSTEQRRPASALQIIPPSGDVDAQDARTRARVPAAHLTAEKIAEALKASSGVMAEAARRLRISRNTLYVRARADPVVEAARTEAREVFLDLGESELYRLVKEGNPSAVFFLLRTLGARRGWREGVLVEQRPESTPRHTPEEVTRRLRSSRRTRSSSSSGSFSRWKARPPSMMGWSPSTTSTRRTQPSDKAAEALVRPCNIANLYRS